MQEHVMSLPGKLSEEVAEGGDNFSTGQRQVKQVSLFNHHHHIILSQSRHITHSQLSIFEFIEIVDKYPVDKKNVKIRI